MLPDLVKDMRGEKGVEPWGGGQQTSPMGERWPPLCLTSTLSSLPMDPRISRCRRASAAARAAQPAPVCSAKGAIRLCRPRSSRSAVRRRATMAHNRQLVLGRGNRAGQHVTHEKTYDAEHVRYVTWRRAAIQGSAACRTVTIVPVAVSCSSSTAGSHTTACRAVRECHIGGAARRHFDVSRHRCSPSDRHGGSGPRRARWRLRFRSHYERSGVRGRRCATTLFTQRSIAAAASLEGIESKCFIRLL